MKNNDALLFKFFKHMLGHMRKNSKWFYFSEKPMRLDYYRQKLGCCKYALLIHFIYRPSGTVADNIRYGPQLRGKKLSDDEVHKLLNLADLDSSFFSQIGSELSVGQAQRVALARTLANAPEVCILTCIH